MTVYAYKTVLTWENEHNRQGLYNEAFQAAGISYLESVIPDEAKRWPEKIVIDGTEIGTSVWGHPRDVGPLVVTRTWETQQQAQDFVDFTLALCAEYDVSVISAVVEPNT